MIRVVLFDLGGLLIELSGIDTFRSWVGDRFTVEDIWHRWLTSPAVRAFEMGESRPDAFADQLIEEFGLPVNREEFLSAFTSWPRGTYPGAEDLVRRVDRRCARAMLSNSNVLHWLRVLSEFGLGDLFEHVSDKPDLYDLVTPATLEGVLDSPSDPPRSDYGWSTFSGISRTGPTSPEGVRVHVEASKGR